MQRGHDAEQQAGDRGDGDGRDKHAQVERDVHRTRDAIGHGTAQRLHDPPRDDDAKRRPDCRQDQTLDEELADQTPSAGPERRAHGNLALTSAGASEQQVGDVGAGDEEHDAYRGEQHHHPRSDARTHEVIVKRPDTKLVEPAPARVGGGNRVGDAGQLRLRLREGDSRFQPCDAVQVDADAAPARSLVRRNNVGDQQFGRPQGSDRIGHVWRQDPNHLVAVAVEPNRPPNHIVSPAETLAPEDIAHDGNAIASIDFVFGGEDAASCGPNPKHIEESG